VEARYKESAPNEAIGKMGKAPNEAIDPRSGAERSQFLRAERSQVEARRTKPLVV
jgi:hypothetical protein